MQEIAGYKATGTYGDSPKVKPLEAKYIGGYTNKYGQDFIGILPDIEREDWFNIMIQKYGLEQLCYMYPYQPLMVNKKTGMLEPVDKSCKYNAKATNIFHAVYWMQKEQQEAMQMKQAAFANPAFGGAYVQTAQDIVRPSMENLVEQAPGYKTGPDEIAPHWADAYHHEPEVVNYMDENLTHNRMVQNQQDVDAMYGIKNVDCQISNQNPPMWHPNQNVNNAYSFNNGIPGYNYGVRDIPSYATGYGATYTPNPYMYNPALPQYNSPDVLKPSDANYDSMSVFGDAYARKVIADQQQVAQANAIKQRAMQGNPTMLETSGNTVDFSNPASVAQYANPYYNNLNNPNFTMQQGGVMPKPSVSPYSLSNPFGRTIYNNNGYGWGNYNYGFGWNGFRRRKPDLSYLDLTEEEKRNGIKPKFKIKVVVGEAESVQRVQKQEVKRFKIGVVKTHDIFDEKGNLLESVPVDEWKDRQEQIKKDREAELQKPIYSLLKKVDWIHGTNTTEEDQNKALSRFKKPYLEKVNKLVESWMIYDEGRALMIVESLYEDSINADEFRSYLKASDEDLRNIRIAEQTHSDIDYREPYMFRETPPSMYSGDKYIGPAYKFPKKRYFTLDDGKVVTVHRQPRGWNEPTKEDWILFMDRLRAERDRKIDKAAIEEMQKRVARDEEAMTYNPWDPWASSIQKWKQEQLLKQKQHDFFKYALRNRMDDDEFETWWNHGVKTYKPQNMMTPQERLNQITSWRDQRSQEHVNFLMNNVQPINWNYVQANWANRVNMQVKAFENGAMDNVHSLRDFFDSLGYLNVRDMEERIDQQRKQGINIANTIDKQAFHRDLVITDNSPFIGSEDAKPGVQAGTVSPTYGLPSNYIDYSNVEGYMDKRNTFSDFCQTSKGTVSMKPIYR